MKDTMATTMEDNHPQRTEFEDKEIDRILQNRKMEEYKKNQQIRQIEEQLQLEITASSRNRYDRDTSDTQSRNRASMESDRLRNSSDPYDYKRGYLIEELRRLEEEKYDNERERLIEELRRAKEEREANAQKLIKEQMEKEEI